MDRNIILILAIAIVATTGSLIVKIPLALSAGPGPQAQKILSSEQEITPATFVGRQRCAECHQEQHDRWLGSHHDLAMQMASEDTVLGDFEHASFTHFGLTSTFYRRNGKFMVRTDGPDDELHDYEIHYTLGVYPLQQYLIAFPGGRYQALGIAWDSRSQQEGGQRWFHLYPNERVGHNHILHWTGPNQNWNFMCAECHSTALQKNYDLTLNRYNTTWSEIDVSCEACHGPGSRHVEWARRGPEGEKSGLDADHGLVIQLNERDGTKWIMDPRTGNARRNIPRKSNTEIEVCARCHARRSVLAEDYVHGRPLLDTYWPQLLTEGLYYADGQIQDEVYVYGSFLQSKMYHQGVTCSDCHEPHSLALRAPGNGVCLQCHLAPKYATADHHFHQPGSEGASCAECHLPSKTYMVIDPRHDHSIRIPRPDLTVTLGIPNACNHCHRERSAEWAAIQLKTWYGHHPKGYQAYAEALHAGRTGQPDAEGRLIRLAGDTKQPAIARATAITALRAYLSPASIEVIQGGLHDDDPLIRVAAVDTLEGLEPSWRLQLAFHLLEDSIRAVRIQAARVLAPVSTEWLTDEQYAVLDKAIGEYIAAQEANAERPEAHLNLGGLYVERGQFAKAELAYRTALKLEPRFIQGYVNLADLYRLQGRDDAGERLLRQALAIASHSAEVYHALGLLLVRQQRLDAAIEALGKAAQQNPANPRYGYVYAIALNETGRPKEAIQVLETAHRHHPSAQEILYALVTFHEDAGNLVAAQHYAEKLLVLSPQDPNARRLRD